MLRAHIDDLVYTHPRTHHPTYLSPSPPQGADVPTAYATELEKASFPSVDDIVKVVKQTLGKA
jgi:hypothetical protein